MRKIYLFLLMLIVGISSTWANTKTATLQASSTLPTSGTPEHQYYVVGTVNGKYWDKNTANCVYNVAKFAFYSVSGQTDQYDIYDLTLGKWLTYTSAASYSNGKNFVSTCDDRPNTHFKFTLTTCTSSSGSTSGYAIQPINTSGSADHYLNYFEGMSNNTSVGLWEQAPTTDDGSTWSIVEVPSSVVSVNFANSSTPFSSVETESFINGVITSDWMVRSGSSASEVSGTFKITDNNSKEVGKMVLSTPKKPWGPSATNNTTEYAIQASYLDVEANSTQWTIKSGVDYYKSDLYLYFAGDGGSYSPITINGSIYKGGTDAAATESTNWGDRSTNKLFSDDNRIIKTANFNGTFSIANTLTSAGRPSISGLQILDKTSDCVYTYAITSNVNAADASWTKGSTTSVIKDITEADRHMAISGSGTMTFDGQTVQAIVITDGTVTIAGNLTVGSIFVKSGATVIFNATVNGTAPDLNIYGMGTCKIDGTLALRNLTVGYTALHLNSTANVSYTGSYSKDGDALTYDEGAKFNASTTYNTYTSGGTTVASSSTGFNVNPLYDGVNAIFPSSAADVTITSTGGNIKFTKASTATDDIALTATSLAATSGTTTIETDEGATISTTKTGWDLDQSQTINLKSGVTVTNIGTLAMGNATMTLDGGNFTTTSLLMQNFYSNKTSILNVKSGTFTINGTTEAGYKSGSVRLAHWDGQNRTNLNVNGGTLNCESANIGLGDDGAANFNVNAGTANVMGIWNRQTAAQVNLTGGRLNIGTKGLTGTLGAYTFTGGTLGALGDWSTAFNLTLGKTTINTNKYVPSSASEDGTATITMSGNLTVNDDLTITGAGTFAPASGKMTIASGKTVDASAQTFDRTKQRKLIAAATGDGTLKLAQSGSELIVASDTDPIVVNSNVTYTGSGQLILCGQMDDHDKLTINAGKTFTIADGIFYNKRSTTEINGNLVAKNVLVGHELSGTYPGVVNLNNGGSMSTELLRFTNYGGSKNSQFNMTGGTLEFKASSDIASAITKVNNATYEINITGGTLKASNNSWTVPSGIAMNIGGATLATENSKSITLANDLTMTGTITNNGTATLSGALSTSDITTFEQASTGDVFSDGENGFVKATYYVVKNGTDASTTVKATSMTISGTSYTLTKDADNGETTVTLDGTTGDYYVNTTVKYSEVKSKLGDTANFRVMKGGKLILDESFDLTRVKGEGEVVIAADNATLTSSKVAVAIGKLTVNEGTILTIGNDDDDASSVASFSSIDLAGQITINNSKTTLNNVTVPAGKTGKIFSYDNNSKSSTCLTFAGTTTLNGDMQFCNYWKCNATVAKLVGTGSWTCYGSNNDSRTFDTGSVSRETLVLAFTDATAHTGGITLNNDPSDSGHTSTITINSDLSNETVTKTAGDAIYYNNGGTLTNVTFDGVTLSGSSRNALSGTINIANMSNNRTGGTFNYAMCAEDGTLNVTGNCDFTHQWDGTTENTYNALGYKAGQINIKEGATLTVGNYYYNTYTTNNAATTIESGATLTSTGTAYIPTFTTAGTATFATVHFPTAATITMNNTSFGNTTPITATTIGTATSLNMVFSSDALAALAAKLTDNSSSYTLISATTNSITSVTINGGQCVAVDGKLVQLTVSENCIVASLKTPDYTRTNLTSGNFGTICLPNAVNAGQYYGCKFYSVLGTTVDASSNVTGIILEEQLENMVAGQPYLIRATASELGCAYTGEAVTSPVTATGLVGNLSTAKVTVSDGNYVLSNNQLRKVNGGKATISQNKAYINLTGVYPYSPSEARKVVTINVEDTATGINSVEDVIDALNDGKYIQNGNVIIVKSGKKFGTNGMRK